MKRSCPSGIVVRLLPRVTLTYAQTTTKALKLTGALESPGVLTTTEAWRLLDRQAQLQSKTVTSLYPTLIAPRPVLLDTVVLKAARQRLRRCRCPPHDCPRRRCPAERLGPT